MASQSAEGSRVTVMKSFRRKTIRTPGISRSVRARGSSFACSTDVYVLLRPSVTLRSRVNFRAWTFGVGWHEIRIG